MKLSLVFAVALALLSCTREPPLEAIRVAPITLVAPPEPAAPPTPTVDPLIEYVTAAMIDAVPLKRQLAFREGAVFAMKRYRSIAADIVTASRAHGAEAFPHVDPDVAAAHLAVVLVAIGAHESGFYLPLDGDSRGCTPRLGGCDANAASSAWQVHAERGHERLYYANLAAAQAAYSLRETRGLCYYTASCAFSRAEKDIRAIYEPYWLAHSSQLK